MNPSHYKTQPLSPAEARGNARLRFDGYLEDEFRRFFARSSVRKARPIVSLAAVALVVTLAWQIGAQSVSWITAAFGLVVILPALILAIYLSYQPDRHGYYQYALAFSALLIGIIGTSVCLRGGLAGQGYYFGAEVGMIFATWLVLGLLFRHAAATALTLSMLYVFGLFYWDFSPHQRAFDTTILLLVNVFAAYCCYQLEYQTRRAFQESRRLNQLAQRDGLTGLLNRRSFDESVARIWRQARRENGQFTLLMVDIDQFKSFNDQYGHQAGDDALRAVAQSILNYTQRPLDFAARFGGEEFALVLYGPPGDYGSDLPERLRGEVESLRIPHEDSPVAPWLTVSIGAAVVVPEADRSLAGAIQLADEALYQAKEDGRNRVVLVESPLAPTETGRFRKGARGRKLSA